MLLTTSKVDKIWTSSPLTVCISAIKMIVYTAINHKLESREKIVGGGEKKKSRHKTTRSLFNRKQSDGG